MPGKINCINVASVIESRFNSNWTKLTVKFRDNHTLDKNDSYIAIFSRWQDDRLKCLVESDAVTVLHISDKAVNPVHKENGPSNTVVVFELK